MKVTLLVLLFATATFCFDDDFAPDLYLVNKIYVADMGSTDEAARFKLLLDEALSKKGFIVVDTAEKADAIISGILTVRVYDSAAVAHATVLVKNKDGKRLWSGDFGPPTFRSLKRKDTVQARADTIADHLRDDWKKTAKAAGVIK